MKEDSAKTREALQRVAKHARSFDIRSEALLHEALSLLDEARQIPLSPSVRVNREQMAALLGEALDALPGELAEARQMLEDRAEFMAERDREAREILDEVRAQAERMVQRSEMVREAKRAAQHIVDEAKDTAKQVKREVDEYCDKRLAAFEVSLERVLRSVKDGRERMKTPASGASHPDAAAPVHASERGAPKGVMARDPEAGGALMGSVAGGSDRSSDDAGGAGGRPSQKPGGVRPVSSNMSIAPGVGSAGARSEPGATDAGARVEMVRDQPDTAGDGLQHSGRSGSQVEMVRDQPRAGSGHRDRIPPAQQPATGPAMQHAATDKGDAGNVPEKRGDAAGRRRPMVTEPPLRASSEGNEDEGGGNFFDQDKQ
ncbi:MAG: hypothetical protein M1399_01530 [Actinobacteria bacterium]|nr:hypothetical protein [Actinomycetota bacterium]MCL5445837.1 hypothetical protein [Actinomycetota bacterium]